MIDVTLIGTAATMPLPDRALSSALLRSYGRTILFDCGEGTQTAARKAKVSLMKTDLIALTHYHGDHIFGLPGLMQSMNCLGRTDTLYITGPEGLEREMAPILSLAGELAYEVKLLTRREIRLSNLNCAWPPTANLMTFDTEHRTKSQGYRFELARNAKFDPDRAHAMNIPIKYWKDFQRCESPDDTVCVDGKFIRADAVTSGARKGLSIVFSGDTAPCPGLEAASRDTDLLICDATYGSDEQMQQAELYGHSTFRQASELAARAGARRLWLTHFSQTVEPENCLCNAQRAFPDARCGYDGMTITLKFD